VAEAALLRDEGEVARLLGSGEDPNGRYRIRRTLVHRSLTRSRHSKWRRARTGQ
jgi:hypothetical protein